MQSSVCLCVCEASLDVPGGQVSVSQSSPHEMIHASRDLTGNEHQVLSAQHLQTQTVGGGGGMRTEDMKKHSVWKRKSLYAERRAKHTQYQQLQVNNTFREGRIFGN